MLNPIEHLNRQVVAKQFDHTPTCSIAVFMKNLFVQKIGLLLVCALSAGLWSHASTAALSAEQAAVVINLSGKQRMLTQKMSKESILVALNIDTEANAGQLAKTVALFDKTLNGLKAGDDDLGLPATESKRILRQLNKVNTLWSALKPDFDAIATSKSATKEQIASIADKNLPLLKAMNKAVLMYEKEASKGGAKKANATAINLAGKQRMLTQKMTKESLLVAYGHQTEENQINLLDTYSLFERTLSGLKAGDDVLGLAGTDNAGVLAQLSTVEKLWGNFKPLIKSIADTAKADPNTLANIASSNLPLLKEMNKAVKLFEKIH